MTDTVEVVVSNQLHYEAYLSSTCQEIVSYDKKHLRLAVEFASYLYQRIQYGIKNFGKKLHEISGDLEREMSNYGRVVGRDTILSHYYTIQFLEEISFEDKVLFDRIMTSVNHGDIRMSHLTIIAKSGKDFDHRVEVLTKVLKDRAIGVSDVKMLLGAEGSRLVAYSNLFSSVYIMDLYRQRYLQEGTKIFVPFDTGEETHGMFRLAAPDVRKNFYLSGKFTENDGRLIEDESYDGVFLLPPQFNLLNHSKDFNVDNIEDFLDRMVAFLTESLRITKVDGIIGVLTWNRPLYKSDRYDFTNIVYNTLDSSCEWVDTVINPLSPAARKKFPHASYRTINIFKKR